MAARASQTLLLPPEKPCIDRLQINGIPSAVGISSITLLEVSLTVSLLLRLFDFPLSFLPIPIKVLLEQGSWSAVRLTLLASSSVSSSPSLLDSSHPRAASAKVFAAISTKRFPSLLLVCCKSLISSS